LVTAKLFTALSPLPLYVAIGYAFVVHAAAARPRLAGLAARVVPGASLAAWTLVWFAVKDASWKEAPTLLDRLPMLSFTGAQVPSVVGASYVFLKALDLIRRAQRGEP